MSKQLFVEQLHTESSPLVKVAIGLLAGLVSSLIYRWNRHAASQDALAYAAMIRQQQEAAVEQKQQQMDTHQKETDGETEAPDSRESVSSDARVYPALPASDGSDTIEDINNIQAEEEVDDEKESSTTAKNQEKAQPADDDDTNAIDLADFQSNSNQWRCACEGGFLPPGMLSSLGGAEAVFRMGTGQCYHKQA